MSDAIYILGSVEYVMVEIESATPGVAFVPAEWTAKLAIAKQGSAFVDIPGNWQDATIETVDGHYYAKAMLSDLTTDVGKYRVLVKLTQQPAAGIEVPIMRAIGTVSIEAA